VARIAGHSFAAHVAQLQTSPFDTVVIDHAPHPDPSDEMPFTAQKIEALKHKALSAALLSLTCRSAKRSATALLAAGVGATPPPASGQPQDRGPQAGPNAVAPPETVPPDN